MRRGQFSTKRGLQREQDRIHHGGQGPAPGGHGRGMPRHHVVAFLDFHLQRAKCALVDRFPWRRQRLVSDQRRRECPRVNRGSTLRRTLGEVDGHVAALDDDADFDFNGLIPVQGAAGKQRLCLIDTVRQIRNHGPATGFGLIEDAFDGLLDGGAPVTQQNLFQPPFGEPVCCDLRFQVPHRSVWKTDVVANQAPYLFIQPACFIQLDMIELQALHPRIERIGGSKAGAEAADIRPMRACRSESK